MIGGTGRISSACVRAALQRGLEVYVLNRGQTGLRPLPNEVQVLHADARDTAALKAALGDHEFDAVVQFIAKEPAQVKADLSVFAGRTGQYIFISSASAYQKPVTRLPISESTPLVNPFWQYSRDKISCEDLLIHAHREFAFPATIVRPSHTYDRTSTPFDGGWTVVERMRQNKPVIVHGDGTSLWVLTHHDDFARAFAAVLCNPLTIGDAFHITSDEVLSWNQIYSTMADAAGVEARLVHVASEAIAEAIPKFGAPLLGDKAHSVIFDNSKIRQLSPGWHAVIPFAVGAREIIEWHDADPSRRQVDPELDAAIDKLTGGG